MVTAGESSKRRARRPSLRECAAYHQAGHGVIAWVFKQAIVRLSLETVEYAHTRHVRRALANGTAPWWRMQQAIMVMMAGDAAEALFSGRPARSSLEDAIAARELAGRICLGEDEIVALIEWLYVRTRTMLTLPDVWKSVGKLAHVLVAGGELTGAQVEAIVSRGMGRR